ncbi:MAG: hypothetical protein JEZ14_20395 [Marinilabiliaceae bacterium]|nr:hypothetical protein [Marinilabiliaceae bacterium]
MKSIVVLVISLVLMCNDISAQKIPTQTVGNIDTRSAIQIIEAAAKELNYPLKQFDPAGKVLITDWIEWTSIAVTNHGKLKFEAKNNEVIISMIDREYASSEGWSATLTNLSKKNIKKYLGTMADKISEIAGNTDLCQNAMYHSELIKMFKPLVIVDGIEWKFIKGVKDFSHEKMKTPNYFMELSITNTTDQAINFKTQKSLQYRDPGKKNSGSAVQYVVFSLDEIFSGVYQAELQPNETRKVYVYSLLRYLELLQDDCIPLFKLGFNVNNHKAELINYNVTVPFENQL